MRGYNISSKSIKFSKKIFGDLKSVFGTIKKELRSNRYVIVPLKIGTLNNAWTYHNHVIYDFNKQGEYKTITTLWNKNNIEYVKDMEQRFTENFNDVTNKERLGIDILVYEITE